MASKFIRQIAKIVRKTNKIKKTKDKALQKLCCSKVEQSFCKKIKQKWDNLQI